MAESEIKPLTMPNWGMNMEEGTIVQWLVGVGDAFKAGDEVVEIETSKSVNVLEAPFSGTLQHIVADAGETLAVGELIGVVADAAPSAAELNSYISGFRGIRGEPPANTPPSPVTTATAGGATGADDSDVPAMPMARKLARELGINLRDCEATGSRGRVSKEDVEAAHARLLAAAAGGAEPVETPLSSMRMNIAARLQSSKLKSPHFRLVVDCDMDGLLACREEYNKVAGNAPLSVNDFLIKACALALMEVPECNIQFNGLAVKQFPHADISIAVALDDGLITPILKAAEGKSLAAIAAETRTLIDRARAGQLRPEEYEGGTFTLSNLGMYGIKQFDAIINPPQAAILAVGSVEQRVVVRDNAPAIASMLTLSLSCDHRVIDGALGARFLQALKEKLANPELLLK